MGQPAASVALALAGLQGFSSRELDVVRGALTRRPSDAGRPWDEFPGAVQSIAHREFTWPEFDRWQAFFAARDRFPVRWEGLQQAPPPSTPAAGVYQQRKLTLLVEWLEAIARRSAIVAHYARQGLATRVAQQDSRDSCTFCAVSIAAPRPGLEVMPPFHPGCRCILLAVHVPGARPRPRRA